MKAIEDAIRKLEAERNAFNIRIDGRMEGLREALRLQNGSPPALLDAPHRMRRGNLKDVVLSLMERAAEHGLTPEECVAQAKADKGVVLIHASVSSLLSRLKADDVLFYDGLRYRLKQFAGPKAA